MKTWGFNEPQAFLHCSSLPCAVSSDSAETARAPVKVRWLVSVASFSPQLERELSAIVREFNQINRKIEVEVQLHGDDYSTLRDLSVASLAGTLPDLATIEPSEADALNPLAIGFPSTSNDAKLLQINPVYLQKTRPNSRSWWWIKRSSFDSATTPSRCLGIGKV
jgi:ABC-type glycerol-3-phosphate transport system substrate-binding protein